MIDSSRSASRKPALTVSKQPMNTVREIVALKINNTSPWPSGLYSDLVLSPRKANQLPCQVLYFPSLVGTTPNQLSEVLVWLPCDQLEPVVYLVIVA